MSFEKALSSHFPVLLEMFPESHVLQELHNPDLFLFPHGASGTDILISKQKSLSAASSASPVSYPLRLSFFFYIIHRKVVKNTKIEYNKLQIISKKERALMNFETAQTTYGPSDRLSGILLHPTSLPSPYGIGDLGDGAYEFIDFLNKAGQHLSLIHISFIRLFLKLHNCKQLFFIVAKSDQNSVLFFYNPRHNYISKHRRTPVFYSNLMKCRILRKYVQCDSDINTVVHMFICINITSCNHDFLPTASIRFWKLNLSWSILHFQRRFCSVRCNVFFCRTCRSSFTKIHKYPYGIGIR